MRVRSLVAFLAASVVLPAAAAAAPAPPTLTTEHFAPTFVESVGLCDRPNPIIFYHVIGLATGPYPGPFEETGSIVITPAGATTVSPLIDVDAEFTIDSPTGAVEGEKHFTASSGIGECRVVGPPEIRSKTAKADDLEYVARITTGPGMGHRFVDCGSSDLFFSDVTVPPAFTAFGEDFFSSLTEPERDRKRLGACD